MDILSNSKYTAIHILQVAFPEEKFLIHEIMSLHSVHTQYEEMSALDSPVEQKCS